MQPCLLYITDILWILNLETVIYRFCTSVCPYRNEHETYYLCLCPLLHAKWYTNVRLEYHYLKSIIENICFRTLWSFSFSCARAQIFWFIYILKTIKLAHAIHTDITEKHILILDIYMWLRFQNVCNFFIVTNISTKSTLISML